ncbi:MAG: plastocyanin/azurin family copper-binding protein [Bacteroidota bacterium]
MNNLIKYILLFCLIPFSLSAQNAGEVVTESDYYPIMTLPIPEGLNLEGGGLVTMPDGNLGLAARRGDIYIVENPYMENGQAPHYRKFAMGLHEPLGIAYKNGTFYVAQRGELTRLWDKNGDGEADFYESVHAWPLSGHYHEYSYGPVIGEDGNMFVSGNVAFGDVEWWRGESRVPWRGWISRIQPDGTFEPWATGVRSPCGLGIIDGDLFYADNQGDWIGSGALVHIEKGDFVGHPAGLRWSELPESPVKITTEDIYSRVDPKMAKPGEMPIKPEYDASERPNTFFELEEELEGIKTPAIWLPHSVLGISTSQILPIENNPNFGPFEGQILIGDQGQSKIARVSLEKVNNVYQGVAFGFVEGFRSGVLRMTWGKDGSLFVGQTNRGWGSTGPEAYALQRVVWSGETPFEMKTVKAMPDGFEIEFTLPVDKATASNPASYQVMSFIYKYHPVYGSPVVRDETCLIKGVKVSEDGLKARIVVDKLRRKFIHEIQANGVKSTDQGLSLLHPTAYYTLNEIPDGPKLDISTLASVNPQASVVTKPKKQAMPQATPTSTSIAPSENQKRMISMPKSWANGPDQTISMATEPGLQFDVKTVTVKAGSKIKLTFNNDDDMPHNLVVVRPGTADAVGTAALGLGVKGMNLGYIPEDVNILHHTQLLQPGISESIYFTAPTEPGEYTYVCTYPGHYLIMRGVFKVVE